MGEALTDFLGFDLPRVGEGVRVKAALPTFQKLLK